MNTYIAAEGSFLRYLIIGEGTPIVFLHGWGVDHKLWMNKVESIKGKWKKHYRRVYIDLPGMGKSIASKSIRNSDDINAVIKEFLSTILNGDAYLLAG